MVRRLVSLVAAGALSVGLVAFVPMPARADDPVGADVVVGEEGDGSQDSPEVPAVPLVGLSEPSDPADEVVGLPDELSALPEDVVGEVEVDGSWVEVPGIPVEVQAADPGPDGTGSDDDVIDSVDPGGPVAEGDDVVVSLESPEDGRLATLLVQVGESAAADPSLSPDDGEPSPEPGAGSEAESVGSDAVVDVRVSYEDFAQVYGGGWAERLQVTAFPACYAETPSDPVCSQGVPLEANNNERRETLTFTTIDADAAALQPNPEDAPPGPGEPTAPIPSAETPNEAPGDSEPESPATDEPEDAQTDAPSPGTSSAPAPESETPDTEPGTSEPATQTPAAATGPGTTDTLVGAPRSTGIQTQVSSAVYLARERYVRARSSEIGTAGAAGRTLTGPPAAAVEPTGGTVYAVSGGAGSYASQPVSPSAVWQTGTGSGEFSYSYPFEFPAALGGQAPSLGLSYSSAAVDGMTMAENGQASQAGLGWADLSPGYVTRSYASCAKDGEANKGDLCWKTRNGGLVNEYSMVFDGKATELVRVGNSDTFRLRDDQGWLIELKGAGAGVSNPDNDNEAFKVTTTDGTVYWFGRSEGGAKSVWTVPVYGNDSGEPCYTSTKANAWCDQAWRWNLDRVTDTSGNTINYFYNTETNYYSRWGNTSSAYRTDYVRAGALERVEYGYARDSGQPRQMVLLDQVRRCTENTGPGAVNSEWCTGTNGPQEAPNLWPDVPADLICGSTGSCLVGSPSFFTLRMYKSIETQTLETVFNGAAPTVRKVDTYEMRYTMPDPDGSGGDPADLWLNQIIRTGHVSGTATALPAVKFDGVALKNRVNPGGGRPFYKYRLDSARTETGGRIDVVYGHADNKECTPDYVENTFRWGSTKECWAQRFTAPDGDESWEWFHKYVVTQVGLSDDVLGYRLGERPVGETWLGSLRVYDYTYQGAPAWRFNNSKNTDVADETWGDWRGYETTVVHTSKITQQTAVYGDVARTKTTRFRGMLGSRKNLNGDSYNDNETKLDTDQFSSASNEPSDQPWLAGLTAEESSLEGDGTLIERTYTDYNWFPTADDSSYQARIRYPHYTETTTKVVGSANRTHRVDVVVHEGGPSNRGILAGVIKATHDHGDPGTNNDDRCATTDWASNDNAWIRVPVTQKSYAGTCDSNGNSNGTLLARTDTIYDRSATTCGPAGNAAQSQGTISKGLPTQTQTDTGPATIYNTTAYDTYGRVVKQWDGNGNCSKVDYNPGGSIHNLLRSMETTDAMGFTTATDLEPRKQLPTSVTDANNDTTTITYNGLGQPLEVSLPPVYGTARATNIVYDYDTRADAPSRVHTKTLRSGQSTYDHAYEFYDGWGRLVETHIPQPASPNERIVSVSGYDEQGQVRYAMPALPNVNNNGFSAVVNPNPSNVSSYTITNYDAAARPTGVKYMNYGSQMWASATTYKGDKTISSPPVGGDTVTWLDHYGQTTKVDLHAGAAGSGNIKDSAEYAYDGLGQLQTLKKLKDGSTNQYHLWEYGYDRAGRQVSSLDPDTGAVVTKYDANGNPVESFTGESLTLGTNPWQASVSMPRASHITTTYDALNRPLVRTDKTGSTDKTLTTWTYDVGDNGNGRLRKIDQVISGVGPLFGGSPGIYTTRIEGYDNRGQVTQSTDLYPGWITGEAADTATVSKTTLYDYNQAGQQTNITYPAEGKLGQTSIDTSYTTNGALDAISGGALTIAEASYNNVGKTIELKSSGPDNRNLKRTYGWSPSTGRLSTIIGTALAGTSSSYTALSLDYAYDPNGNPTRIAGTRQAAAGGTTYSGAWCYTYDGLDRLLTARTGSLSNNTCGADAGTIAAADGTGGTGSRSVTGRSYNLAYAYGNTGDRIKGVTPAGGAAALYTVGTASKPHQTTAISAGTGAGTTPGMPTAATMSYDKVGRITRLTNNTAGAVTDYIYDAPGDLTSTITKVGGQQVNKTTNAYNADGTRLIRREVTTTGTTTSTATTLYRSDGTELTCLNTCSATNNADLARGTRPIVATDRGVPVAVRNSTGWTWLLADNQHTIRVARDPDGTIRRTFYGPYGDTPSVSNNQTAPNTPNKRGYLNQPHDANGDVRLDQRNFTPTLSILTTPDPYLVPGDPQSLNPYSYARNNPIGAFDPSGMGPCSNSDVGVSCPAHDPAATHNPPDSRDPEPASPEPSSPAPTPDPPLTTGELTQLIVSGELQILLDHGFALPSNVCLDIECINERIARDGGCDAICNLQISRAPTGFLIAPAPHGVSLEELSIMVGAAVLASIGARSVAAKSVDNILPTPQVGSTKLQNLVDNLYKGTTNPNRVGNGTTMDAIRNELATGVPTGGRMHSIKGQETLNGLNNWLRRNPGAPYYDRLVGQSLADELLLVLRSGG